MNHRHVAWLVLLVCCVRMAFAEELTFFPNQRRVLIPRGTAQLVKPYLPKPEVGSDNYCLVMETPDYVKFVAVENRMGSPPKTVKMEPGPARDGIQYTKHTLLYDVYPASGFELSMCWLDKGGATISYQPGICAGGTFDWRRFTATVTPPPQAAAVKPLIIKWQNRGITGTFWVDNLVLREENSDKNLLRAGTFDEPEWKSGLIHPEGKDGGKCAKFVCPPERAEGQQALWVDPELKSVPIDPAKAYVVELDLKAEKLGPPKEEYIAALLFRVDETAPEGKGVIYTSCASSNGKASEPQKTELIVLPPLKDVRPKEVRIAPCMYGAMFSEPIAQAYAENAWRSGVTWTYGSVLNNIVPILWPRGHRVWLAKPGEPFAAHGDVRDLLKECPEVAAVGFDGKPRGHLFCPEWLLSGEGEKARHVMEDDLVEQVDRDGYTAVNWDIEQPVLEPPEKGFCFCERCLAAFRKQAGLPPDEKLDGKTILEERKEPWVMFRCRQNAEIVRHCRQALKRCKQPIEFSVYSGYQGQKTREHYGVDWALLAPHLDLGIAGYGGSRQAIRDTIAALGKTPFIGGENYFLSATPMASNVGWIKNSMQAVPNPERWRNQLLRQCVDSGCNGVLIWYLPTMDGGAFYATSEAAEIIATHEDIFRKGKRCDGSVIVNGIKPDYWAAIEHDGKRLLMLLNYTKDEVSVDVEQPGLEGGWKAQLHGKTGDPAIDPKKFTHKLGPYGAAIFIFQK